MRLTVRLDAYGNTDLRGFLFWTKIINLRKSVFGNLRHLRAIPTNLQTDVRISHHFQ